MFTRTFNFENVDLKNIYIRLAPKKISSTCSRIPNGDQKKPLYVTRNNQVSVNQNISDGYFPRYSAQLPYCRQMPEICYENKYPEVFIRKSHSEFKHLKMLQLFSYINQYSHSHIHMVSYTEWQVKSDGYYSFNELYDKFNE